MLFRYYMSSSTAEILLVSLLFLAVVPGTALEAQHRSLRGGSKSGAPGASQASILLGRVDDAGDLPESDMPDMSGDFEDTLDGNKQFESDTAEGNGEDDQDEEEQLSDEGEGHVERLKRVGTLADANNDTRLSAQELRQFAEGLRERKRWEHTDAALSNLDADGDGTISQDELSARLKAVGGNSGIASEEGIEARRFAAADQDADGVLNRDEFHSFAHPELGGEVLRVEAAYQFERFDQDKNRRISFEEFKREAGAETDEDFSEDSVREDFDIHDADGSGTLDLHEFERLIEGHKLLTQSIEKAIGAADMDGDGHIHVHHEVPQNVENLLDSEFIEDFFFHEYTAFSHREEL